MPATEDVWRKPSTMHIVFAISNVALFAATWLMMDRDYADEWRPIQRMNARLQADQLLAERRGVDDPSYEAQQQELKERLAAADQEVKGHQDKIDEKKKEISKLEGEYQLLTREVKEQRAQRDKARADLDIAVRDGALTRDALQPAQ